MRSFSVVIPTLGQRPDSLRLLLRDIRSQSSLPNRVIVADSSEIPAIDPAEELAGVPSVLYHCDVQSAAIQRNDGAGHAVTPVIVFLDDDVRLGEHTLERIVTALEYRQAAGVAGCMEGSGHPRPGWLARKYYQIQAGYKHPHYGSRVLGPAITTFPCWEAEPDDLVVSDWLNTACVAFDREILEKVGLFPPFEGYSPFEDVHLSMRMAKEAPLFFHRKAIYRHESDAEVGGEQSFAMGRTFLKNQRLTARELCQESGFAREAKLSLHKLWILASLLRRRPPGWAGRAFGSLLG